MQNTTISFIGAGNMATAIISGLIRQEFPAKNIWVSNPSAHKLTALQEKLHVNTTQDNTVAITNTEIVVLAIKPQVFHEVLDEIAPIIDADKQLLVSIAAGIRVASIHQWLNKTIPCIRCMPNTPTLVGSGATGLYANEQVSDDQKALTESIMRCVGITQWCHSEDELDILSALSGSGPAFIFLFLEALENAAVDEGLSPETAHLLALQTTLGAAHLAMESNADLNHLRTQVTSPAGMTESGIKALEAGNIRGIIKQAFQKTRARAVELAAFLK